MPPKSTKKDSIPVVQQEDLTQDVLLVVSVPCSRLQMGLLASPQLLSPEPLQDAAASPSFCLELHHSTASAPVVHGPVALGPDFVLTPNMVHMFRHKKGPDIIDRLINATLELRLINSTSKAVLATAHIDLLPLGLGSSNIDDGAVPWQPVVTEEVLKVMPGSTVAVSVAVKHQPHPVSSTTGAASAPSPAASSSGSGSTTGAAAAAVAAAMNAVPAALEPLVLVPPDEAAGCNVLQFTALHAAPLPPSWSSAAHAVASGLACMLQLHLPSTAGKVVLGPRCSGGCSSGTRLEWPQQQQQQQACRMHLSAAVTAALKAHLELGQPLLLEVARYLSGQAADSASDPAFGAYHALLQFDAAAEQLQELGAVSAAGPAVPVACMSSAVQQGKVAAPGLPPCTPPSSARPKPIEEAPAAAADGQAGPCAWAAAGTRFMVALKLARPLYEPWQPPAQPSRRLHDLIPLRAPPPPAPAPTAADMLRAKIQEVALDLANQYVGQAGSTSSTGSSGGQSSSTHVHQDQQQQSMQQLVFELNRSGKYLAIKEQLQPLLSNLAMEQYNAAAGNLSAAELQQLHHDLYAHLLQELHVALAAVAAQALRAKGQTGPCKQLQQQHQGQEQQHPQSSLQESIEQAGCLEQPLHQDPPQTQQAGQSQGVAAEAWKLLQLAAECELHSDHERCHALHTRRITMLPTPDAWCDYGCFCMRLGAHAKAHTALQEALTLDPCHTAAASGLLCLSAAAALGLDSAEGPAADPTAAEYAEVLGHSLKDRQEASVMPWAMLALLYRSQGKAKEASARSCHQEVLRQCKAAWTAAASSAQQAPDASNAAASLPIIGPSASEAQPIPTVAGMAAAAGDVPAPVQVAACDVMPGANGYLAAAELALQLTLPGLANKLLDLAAGLKDPDGVLVRRLQLARARAACAAGDTDQALALLCEVAEGLALRGRDEEKGVLQLLLGDVQYQVGNLALAKQHYRRALQKCPMHFTTRTYLQLGRCFMASGDAAIAADMYAACITAAPGMVSAAEPAAAKAGVAATAPANEDVSVGSDRLIPGRCASIWLQLALAYVRLGDSRSAELALSEANLCDGEHPGVWGQLALLALQQRREGDGALALRQAQRFGLSSPGLLCELGGAFQELGRFESAADCFARAVAVQDSVKVRCRLAAVLLSQRDYAGCRQHLAAAARLPASEAEQEMLEDVVKKLQVSWPLL